MGNQALKNLADSTAMAKSVGSIASGFNLKSVTSRLDSGRGRLVNRALHQGHENLKKPSFDSKKYAEDFVKQQEEFYQNSKLSVEFVPRAKQYVLTDKLGAGAFGVVYKATVEENTENEFAIKVMNLVDGSSQEKERAIESSFIELDMLRQLDHPNIVKYIEHFYLPHDPMDPKKKPDSTKPKKDQDTEPSKNFLCVVMEFVRGSDLDRLLKYSEKEEFYIPGKYAIKWFIELLDILVHCHGKNIQHRDIKPDNILVAYETIDSLEEMKLILTDFGVSKREKDIHINTEEDEEEPTSPEKKEKQNLFGHLFYAPPEVLERKKFDARYDVFSLAILFFQLFYGISTDTYQDMMNKIKIFIRRNHDLRMDFNKFVLKRGGSLRAVSILELLLYIHKSGLYKKHIIGRFVQNDPAIKDLMDVMTCEMDQRVTTSKLVQMDVVKTWRFLLTDVPEKILTRLNQFGVEKICFKACITLLRTIKEEIGLFQNILLVIKKCVLKSDDRREEFAEFLRQKNQLQMIIGKILLFEENEQRNLFYLVGLLNVYLKAGMFVEEISAIFRDYCITDLVKIYCVSAPLDSKTTFYNFAYLIMKDNKTIQTNFLEVVVPLISEFAEHRNKTLIRILQLLIPLIDLENNDLDKISLRNDDDLVMFKNVRVWKMSEFNADMVVDQVTGKIVSIMKNLSQNIKRNGKLILSFMAMLVRMIVPSEPIVHEKMLLVHGEEFFDRLDDLNSLQFLKKSEVPLKVNVEDIDNRVFYKTFEGFNKERKETPPEHASYVVSKDSLVKFKKGELEKEETIAYVEAIIVDGGTNDKFGFGFSFDNTKFVYLFDGEIVQIEKKIYEFKVSINSYYSNDSLSGIDLHCQSVENMFKFLNEKFSKTVKIFYQKENGVDAEWVSVAMNKRSEWGEIPSDKTYFMLRVVDQFSRTVVNDKYPKFKCCTNDVIGVGLTNMGKMYFTKNDKALQFFDVDVADDVEIRVFVYVTNNDFFDTVINFGNERNFKFCFGNVDVEKVKVVVSGKAKKKLLNLCKRAKKLKLDELADGEKKMIPKITEKLEKFCAGEDVMIEKGFFQ